MSQRREPAGYGCDECGAYYTADENPKTCSGTREHPHPPVAVDALLRYECPACGNIVEGRSGKLRVQCSGTNDRPHAPAAFIAIDVN